LNDSILNQIDYLSTPQQYQQQRPPIDQALLEQVWNAFSPRHIADFLLRAYKVCGTDFIFYFLQQYFKHQINKFYTNQTFGLRYDIDFLVKALISFALGVDFSGPLLVPGSIGHTSSKMAAELRFYNATHKLVPNMLTSPTVDSVQALSLLASFSIGTDARGLCYVYVSHALRMAVSLGMHLKSTNRGTTEFKNKVRIRT
jgi:hypothetical protein